MADLFCIHILGPDDLIAAPSELQATDAADEFNRVFGPQATDKDVMLEAREGTWPYGAESHAHSLAKDWPQYADLAKAGRRRRLAGGSDA